MRRFASLCGALCATLVLSACEQDTRSGADTGMATVPAAAPAPAPAAAEMISLAAVAGQWNVRSVPESDTDTAATLYVLNATADTSGWSITFPNREPIPMHVVAVAGDSIVTEAGPFESARRAGVQVRTHAVFRLQNDRLIGTTVARYETTGPDSVLRLRNEGTRTP